jgi:hypothetical protein
LIPVKHRALRITRVFLWIARKNLDLPRHWSPRKVWAIAVEVVDRNTVSIAVNDLDAFSLHFVMPIKSASHAAYMLGSSPFSPPRSAFMVPSPQYAFALCGAQLRAAKRVVDALVYGTERVDHILLQSAKETLHAQLEQAERVLAGGPFLPDATVVRDRVTFSTDELMRAWTDTFGEVMRVTQSWALESSVTAGGVERAMPGLGGLEMANALNGVFEFWNDAYRQLDEMVTRSRDFAAGVAFQPLGDNAGRLAAKRPLARTR